jgi:CDP-glucose 4,6-dehydratase
MGGLGMRRSFWRGRRVFLTGHTGFKGGWLSLWLQHLGARLTGYALAAPTKPSLFELARVDSGMSSVIGDIRDRAKLTAVIRDTGPEVVIHMAAQPLVRQSYVDPVETYSTNVMGTVHLLEAVRQCPSVRAVVNVTTDKCYENREWVWPYRENEPMGGFDPYSSSKGCAELVTGAYRNSFFNATEYSQHQVALASARAGNVIGGGDWASNRLIPDILAAFAAGKPAIIRSPHAIRPWQHVLEPLSGYLLLAQRLFEDGTEVAEAFNFGPLNEDARTVQWVVENLQSLWGNSASWQLDNSINPHEANHLKLDISKAGERLGWYPRIALREALAMTIDWAAGQQRGEDPRALTMRQIDAFMALRSKD